MNASPEPLISRVGQIGMMVKNLDAATAFYRDQLGLRHLFSAGGMAFFNLGELRLMLGQAGPDDPPSTFLYYKVDDIHAVFATLKQRGVTTVEEPEIAHRTAVFELWLAILKDLDGNVFALMAEKHLPT